MKSVETLPSRFPKEIRVALPDKIKEYDLLLKANPDISHSVSLMKEVPTRILVAGRSNSGKTKLTMDLLLPTILPSIDRVILSSPSAEQQGLTALLKRSGKLKEEDIYTDFNEMVLNDMMVKVKKTGKAKRKQVLIVVDDQGTKEAMNKRGQKGVLAEFAANARHMGITSVLLVQGIGMVTKAMRKNIDHLIFFKTIDMTEADILIEEFNDFAGVRGLMRAIYNNLFHNPSIQHPFMYLHLAISKGCACRYFLSGRYEMELTPKLSRKRKREKEGSQGQEGLHKKKKESPLLDSLI